MNKVIAKAPGTENSTAFQTNLNMSTHQVPFGTHGFTGDLVLEFDVNKPIEEVRGLRKLRRQYFVNFPKCRER